MNGISRNPHRIGALCWTNAQKMQASITKSTSISVHVYVFTCDWVNIEHWTISCRLKIEDFLPLSMIIICQLLWKSTNCTRLSLTYYHLIKIIGNSFLIFSIVTIFSIIYNLLFVEWCKWISGPRSCLPLWLSDCDQAPIKSNGCSDDHDNNDNNNKCLIIWHQLITISSGNFWSEWFFLFQKFVSVIMVQCHKLFEIPFIRDNIFRSILSINTIVWPNTFDWPNTDWVIFFALLLKEKKSFRCWNCFGIVNPFASLSLILCPRI